MRIRRSRAGILTTAFALMMAMSLPVAAADLHTPHVGSSCGEGQVGVWHFVNNQTRGAGAGVITATFDDGSVVVVQGPDKVLRNVQHFTITGGTTLDGASTGDLPGKLVLSDFSCEDDKKYHPPVEDPPDEDPPGGL